MILNRAVKNIIIHMGSINYYEELGYFVFQIHCFEITKYFLILKWLRIEIFCI